MNKTRKLFFEWLAVFTVLLLTWSPVFAADSFKPTPITLKTADILPHSLLQGSNYKLAETIINDLNALVEMQKLSCTNMAGKFFKISTRL